MIESRKMVLQVHYAPHLSPDGVQSLSEQLLNRPFRWMLDKINLMKSVPYVKLDWLHLNIGLCGVIWKMKIMT